ncbi:MAG: response regulator, partial [Anaerolineae bacterium]|nr:response regulator [Anaerolineae bacterium]
RKTLETFGCLISEAANGIHGLTLLTKATTTQQPFDVVLLDFMMTPLNGLEVLHIMRQRPGLEHLPVIMMTSSGNVKRLTTSQNPGWASYLTKPVKQTDLIQAMLAALCQHQAEPQPGLSEMAETPVAATSSSIHILLTEDNEVNRQVIVGILKQDGYHITIAENGRQALERLEQNETFDIILMDIQMPIMDGIQA